MAVQACTILPEHVHAVVAAHRLDGDAIMEALKRAVTRRLNGEAIHPFADRPHSNGKLPSPWAARLSVRLRER